ncbi:hypothetical protein [Bergeyella cardium]|uniref:Uncharacterized protein n=1 Tax=Bergeyella cardium TaxID=1585976 RepID=A0A6P1QV48_9FLAO|nr:hypothetical protein [Bergeyella cardium]QHN65418.1 hypothetical protein DBX24_05720 [Bergeyella cardium]WHE32996.1 hypothetical protein P8603_05750 [Bergeyella cardium]WHF59647.1 hypothetical protein O0R51_05745 [Bergeyella cardium]
MRKIFLFLAISCLFFSCNVNKKKEENNNVTQKNNIADTRMEKLKRAFEQNDYTTFFKLFPDTYSELVDFYGFDDDTGKKPLYDFYEVHINYLFEYEEKLSSEFFAEKVYKIVNGGVWRADGIGLFQSNLSELIIHKPNIFLEILTTKPDKEVASFWYFVFDGSGKYDLQNKEKFKTIYKKINSLDKKQGRLLKNEFERMYK